MRLCVCKAEGCLSLTQLFTPSRGLVNYTQAPRAQASSCFGLCRVSAMVALSWQPMEDLPKAELGLTPARGLFSAVVSSSVQQAAWQGSAPREWGMWGWNRRQHMD